jgi:hypothetical protein
LGFLTRKKWIVVALLCFLELPFFFSKLRLQDLFHEDRGIIFADVTLLQVPPREHGKYCEGIRLIIESMDIVEPG